MAKAYNDIQFHDSEIDRIIKLYGDMYYRDNPKQNPLLLKRDGAPDEFKSNVISAIANDFVDDNPDAIPLGESGKVNDLLDLPVDGNRIEAWLQDTLVTKADDVMMGNIKVDAEKILYGVYRKGYGVSPRPKFRDDDTIVLRATGTKDLNNKIAMSWYAQEGIDGIEKLILMAFDKRISPADPFGKLVMRDIYRHYIGYRRAYAPHQISPSTPVGKYVSKVEWDGDELRVTFRSIDMAKHFEKEMWELYPDKFKTARLPGR